MRSIAANWPGEVSAETVFKIADVYGDEELDNPLLECDYLFFVHQQTLLGSDIGGTASTYLSSAMPENIVGTTVGFTAFQSWEPGASFTLKSLRTIFQHEYGHDLGLGHMPSDSTMTYGTYAPMRTTLINNRGFIPFHPRSMEKLGWREAAVEFVDQRLDYEIFDMQSGPGRGVRIPLRDFGGLHDYEYFYLGLYAGVGYAQSYPTRGLAVWHCKRMPNSTDFWDLEQAQGRFDYPDSLVGPDPVAGLDLMDFRWEEPNSYFWRYYIGHPTDFFPVAVDSVTEFSYRTNPSTWGGEFLERLADQDVPLSLTILARSVTDTSVSLDVLPGPREEILSPTSDVTVDSESTLTVTWDDYFNEDQRQEYDILDEVELWFSVGGGDSYERVESADYDNFSLSWDATPRERWATEDGRFHLVLPTR